MMQPIRVTMVGLITCFLLVIAGSPAFSDSKRPLTIEEICQSEALELESLECLKWTPDSRSLTYLKEMGSDTVMSLFIHDLTTGEEKLLIDGETVFAPGSGEPLEVEDYFWLPDGNRILILTDSRDIWRHSVEGLYFVYDLDDDQVMPVHKEDLPIMNVRGSPDGNSIGYVYSSNIYITDIGSGQATRLTHDGSADILNGLFDWVYEEEFGITQAWEWSPDGKRIAFWRMDQSAEKEFAWIEYDSLYQTIRSNRYPKVGEKNAEVRIGIIDLENPETVWVETGQEAAEYIPRITWTPDSEHLLIQTLNRNQDTLELFLADARTGEGRMILSEADDCWVEINDSLLFVDGTDQFVWLSERSGFSHVYLGSLDNPAITALTFGKWEVRRLYGVRDGWVYYCSNEGDVLEKHIWRVRLDSSERERVSSGKGWHSVMFSPDMGHFVDTYSSTTVPGRVGLYSGDGELVRWLIDDGLPGLGDYEIAFPEFTQFTTEDGVVLDAYMIKPPSFEPNRKYPVIIYCYGGPGAQLVAEWWGEEWFLFRTYMAQQGYIIFCLDNRGSGGRGKAFRNLACGELSRYAVSDHIEAAKYLAELPYVDGDRIGIYGHSFGGYLTLMTLTRGAAYFRTGVAGAPVTDFRLYDNIYTERYMGQLDENRAGYDSASVLTWVDSLRGDLLIIHGMSDDNVHVQNSMQLISLLQEKQKQFSLMVYPGMNHGIKGENITCHRMTLMADFFMKNL